MSQPHDLLDDFPFATLYSETQKHRLIKMWQHARTASGTECQPLRDAMTDRREELRE